MAKTFEIEVIVPEGMVAGDKFTVTVEAPVAEKKARGQLAGIALEDMTDEQLKRELINANSVLYKAKQRGAGDETIVANELRVEAAKAEKAKRAALATTTDTPAVDAAFAEANSDESMYNEETSAEI